MEERISKKEVRKLTFESSGQELVLVVELNNLYQKDVLKTKDSLKIMFEEILNVII